MSDDDQSNVCFTSTTWTWKQVRVGPTAGGQRTRGPKVRRWFGRSKRNPREPLTIKVKFRGGAECWYEVHARGEVGRFPGYVALHDVMSEINCTR